MMGPWIDFFVNLISKPVYQTSSFQFYSPHFIILWTRLHPCGRPCSLKQTHWALKVHPGSVTFQASTCEIIRTIMMFEKFRGLMEKNKTHGTMQDSGALAAGPHSHVEILRPVHVSWHVPHLKQLGETTTWACSSNSSECHAAICLGQIGGGFWTAELWWFTAGPRIDQS